MPSFHRSFLFSKDGNPNKRNVHNESALHVLCMGPHILLSEGALQPRLARPYEDERRRAECLQMILKWTGAKLDRGEYESADASATDNKKNTPLHYAAASGMKTCVEVCKTHCSLSACICQNVHVHWHCFSDFAFFCVQLTKFLVHTDPQKWLKTLCVMLPGQ